MRWPKQWTTYLLEFFLCSSLYYPISNTIHISPFWKEIDLKKWWLWTHYYNSQASRTITFSLNLMKRYYLGHNQYYWICTCKITHARQETAIKVNNVHLQDIQKSLYIPPKASCGYLTKHHMSKLHITNQQKSLEISNT